MFPPGNVFRDRQAAALNWKRIRARLPESLLHTFATLLSEVPDPDSALNLFERLLAANPELADTFEHSRTLLHYVLVVFGYSNYLGETLIHNPDLLSSLRRENALNRSYSVEEFRESFARFRARSFETEMALLMARFKRREYVRIMLRDVLGIATLAETTAEISALADVLVEEALREVEAALRNRYGTPQHRDLAGRLVDTFCAVLSLGKLGGNELNYSSDIDLLFVYDDGPQIDEDHHEELRSGGLDNREWFIRLAQQVSELLSRMTAEGFTFRVDLRLRPQGGEGEPAVGLRYAIRYYADTAQDWERQALIKVRHSAGDLSLGRMFIRGVQPFVYGSPRAGSEAGEGSGGHPAASGHASQGAISWSAGKQLNFAAIETALETRDRISRRRAAAARGDSIDIKLDRGGIRDIEFLVQCMQRVYGGAEPWLRSGGTLFSLAKLHDKAHISGKDFHELTTAYEFLRTLEHRLQLRQGQQTHRLPQSEAELAVLARALHPARAGETPAGTLVERVRKRMAAVAEIYSRIIYQHQHHQQQAEELKLPQAARESLAEVSGHRSDQQILERLAQDAPALYQAISAEEVGSHTRRNLLRFLSSALTSAERYAVIRRSPEAVLRALNIFRLSDFLTDILARHPAEVTTLEHLQGRQPEPGEAACSQPKAPDLLLAWSGSVDAPHGERLALLRSHYRHCVFVSGARDLLEPRSVYTSLAETSAAADAAIQAALAIAGQPPGFAILALGRLGTYEFDLLSDADLLFVRDESLENDAAQRTAQQVVHALTAYTREGTVFPVDARLRPRGGEGELVMTPAQLGTYFRQEAQPWEALLFTKLRPIAGDEALARRALKEAGVLISRFASDPRFVEAAVEMRARIETASLPKFGQPEAHSYDRGLKSGPGGVYDADFLVGTLTVLHGAEAGGDETRGNLRDRLLGLQARGLLSPADTKDLLRAAEFLRAVDHAIRLATGRKTLLASEQVRRATAELAARFLGEGIEADLYGRLAEVRTTMRAIYTRLMGELRWRGGN